MLATRRIDLGRLVALLLVLVLSACSGDPPTGPVPIKYGRDTCDFCRMIISDPRFAAQVRGGPGHKAFKFDDLGEGLVWLGMQAWKDEANVEIWVNDMATGKTWLDARQAYYVPVKMSPMGFNYGALTQSKAGALSFEDYRKVIAKSPAALLCAQQKTAAKERAP